jgi:hypothetical protein
MHTIYNIRCNSLATGTTAPALNIRETMASGTSAEVARSGVRGCLLRRYRVRVSRLIIAHNAGF